MTARRGLNDPEHGNVFSHMSAFSSIGWSPRRLAAALALLLGSCAGLNAQGAKLPDPPRLYRVEFAINDGSDAGGPGRLYTMFVESAGKGLFRVGNRVPVASRPSLPGEGSAQFQYIDIGVNIDCRVRELEGKVGLNADIDVSTIAGRPTGPADGLQNPTIASVRMSINTTLNAGKPTLVAAVNDPVTMRKFEVSATVTGVH